jgi:hypothetical protein
MASFVAKVAVAEEQADINTFTVGLAEQESGEGEHLLLQRALRFTNQDRRLGQATYCVVTPSGTAYGGIVSCVLEKGMLDLRLNPSTANKLGARELVITLQMGESSISRLRDGLRRIFPHDDRPAQFKV